MAKHQVTAIITVHHAFNAMNDSYTCLKTKRD